MDSDPYIQYDIMFQNLEAGPMTFGWTAGVTMVPAIPATNIVSAELGGILTDNGGGATMTPESPPAGIPTDDAYDSIPEIVVATLSNDGGTTFTNMGVDLGPEATWTGMSFYGMFSDSQNPGPDPGPDPWDFLRVDINFTLSAGDKVSLAGIAEIIDPVPEPSTLLLLGSGLLGLGYFGRKRMRGYKRG
jgi:hypothetical protein